MHSIVSEASVLDDEQDTQMSIILTPRGKEVFYLINVGFTDKKIGELLCISYSGVRRHREKMLLQNNCSSMLELIAKNNGKSPKVEELEVGEK